MRDRAGAAPAVGVGAVGADALLHHRLDLGRPVSWPTGLAPGQAQLDPVVLGRVVGGGEHGGGGVEGAGGEVDQVGGDQAQVDHVGALGGGALGERGRQLDPRRPHVAAHQDAGGAGEPGEGGADGPGHDGVELVGHDARGCRRP